MLNALWVLKDYLNLFTTGLAVLLFTTFYRDHECGDKATNWFLDRTGSNS